MSTTSHPPTTQSNTDKKTLHRAVIGSMAGTIIEWYEFFIYGTAAALVFSVIFSLAPITHWMQFLQYS